MKKYSKIILLGDINLFTVNWPDTSTSNTIHGNFIETFSDINFEQLITKPTHIGGRILDLLLTTAPEIISDIFVRDKDVVCTSDHFAIEFLININIGRKKSSKRKLFNFKKPNWDDLNNKLRLVNWNAILR